MKGQKNKVIGGIKHDDGSGFERTREKEYFHN